MPRKSKAQREEEWRLRAIDDKYADRGYSLADAECGGDSLMRGKGYRAKVPRFQGG